MEQDPHGGDPNAGWGGAAPQPQPGQAQAPRPQHPHTSGQQQPSPAGSQDPSLKWVVPVGRSWIAVLAGYAGIFAVTVVLAPVAFLLSLAAMIHLKKNPDKLGWGRAIFGLVMGTVFSAILLLVYVGR